MTEVCRASVLHGPKDLRLEERQIDPPGASELQISVRVTGLCGSDLHYYQHYRNGDLHVREPLSLGHESAGVVCAVGADVQGFRIGDRVALEVGLPCGHCLRCMEGRYNICHELRFRSSAKSFPHFQGTLQNRINHPAAFCHKLPDNIAFDLGALLEPLSVATHAARRAQMSRGCSVLVFGAGAVGLLCALMARISGASKVATADVQHGRTRFALEHRFASRGYTPERKAASGAEDRMQGAKDTSLLVSSARRAGDNAGGYDVVFECTGVEACTQAAIYAARPGGKVVIVGMGNPIQTIPLSAAALREVDIIGTFRYANTYTEAIQTISRDHQLRSDLSRLVTHRYIGLENAPKAFEMAARAQDDSGNLVLKVVVENEHQA